MVNKTSSFLDIFNTTKTRYWCFISLSVLILIAFSQCTKDGTNCLTNAGSVIIEKRQVGEFDSINIQGYVNVFLTQDSVNCVSVESGKNIIDGITTKINGHLLEINNTNTCDWLRSYNVPANVHLSVKNLQKVFYEGSGNITSKNTLNSFSISIYIWSGCGTIDLDVNLDQGYFYIQEGTTDLKVKGFCSVCTVNSRDYGFVDLKELKTKFNFIINGGSNDNYVNVSHFLEATVSSIGNIYYTGNPDSLIIHKDGKGDVVPY